MAYSWSRETAIAEPEGGLHDNEPLSDGDLGEFRDTAHTEFVHDMSAVRLNSFGTQVKCVGDFLS